MAIQKAIELRKTLTPRENQVLSMITKGLSNKQTANEIGVDVRSVASYRYNLMNKLGIKEITGLVKYAIVNKITELQQIN